MAVQVYTLWFLWSIGQSDRAIQLDIEAEKRDPLHASCKADLAMLYLWKGNGEAVVRKAREALELNPQHHWAWAALIDGYTATGNYSGVQQILEDMPLTMQQHPRIRARIAPNYISQGDYAISRKIYEELLGLELVCLSQGILITSILAVNLGEVEQAIDLMEIAVDLNMWNQFWTASLLRQNEAVKVHPRYLAHLRRMRLDDESIAELDRRMSFD